MHEENYKIQDNIEDTLAYLASSEPYTMCFDQDTNKPDRKEFLNAAIREVNSHCERKHRKLLPRAEVTKGQPILESV